MHQKTHTTASTMHCTMSKAREMVRLLMPEFGEKLQTAAIISPKTGTSWMRNIITHSETESAMVFSGRYSTAGGAELEENPRARSAKLRVAEKCGFDL